VSVMFDVLDTLASNKGIFHNH